MPILNYTTEVEASKSIEQITACLVKNGARAVLSEYDNQGYIIALSFRVSVDGQEVGFRLPSDWRPVLQLLKSDQRDKRGRRVVPPSMQTQAQALRVSWRILKDWVEAQMALVEIKMVRTEQVFLPYAIMADGKTLYDRFRESPRLLLG